MMDDWKHVYVGVGRPLRPLTSEYDDDYDDDHEDRRDLAVHLRPSTLDIRHSSLPLAPSGTSTRTITSTSMTVPSTFDIGH